MLRAYAEIYFNNQKKDKTPVWITMVASKGLEPRKHYIIVTEKCSLMKSKQPLGVGDLLRYSLRYR